MRRFRPENLHLSASKPPILAQPPAVPGAATARHFFSVPTPGHWLAIAVLSLSGVAAFGLAPDTTLPTVPTRTVLRALPPPALPADDAAIAVYWR
jgi:hypothetical protein